FADDGSPAYGALLTVTPFTHDGDLCERTLATGADGTALVGGLPAARVYVAADRGGNLEIEVRAGATTDAELVIPPGIHVRGHVVDEHGNDVATACVWLSSHAHDCTDGQHGGHTDVAGRFFLRSVERERFLSADAPGLRAAAVQPVRGEPGTTIDLELVLRGAGASLLGTVVGPDGAPVADARVLAGFRFTGFGWDARQDADYRPPLDLRTDERGSFRVDGLELGSKVPLWARAPAGCTC